MTQVEAGLRLTVSLSFLLSLSCFYLTEKEGMSNRTNRARLRSWTGVKDR